MIDLSCLHRPSPPVSDMLLSGGLFELTAGVLLIVIALAAAVAPWVRRRYRRRVIRLMGMDQVAARPAGWWTSLRKAPAAQESATSGVGGANAVLGADDLASRVRDREHRIILATVAAWLSFAVMAWWVAGIYANISRGGRLGFAVAAALLATGPAMTNLPPRWSHRALSIGFIACVLGLLLMANMVSARPTVSGVQDEDLSAWEMALGALLCGAAYLAMFHRSLRGQVLPVFVVLAVAMLLFLVPYGYLERHAGACLTEIDATGEGSPQRTAFVLVATPLVGLGIWLAFRTLDALAGLIERGWLSELSLGSAVSLTVIAVALVFASTPEGADGREAWWAWAPLLWMAVTLSIYALALAPGRRRAGAAGPQLLVLRVFSRDRRKHGLLDEVQSRWRYVGAVHQIGGPDMVAMNVDPYESAMFLSNRLHDLFLPEAASPAQLQARLNSAPDCEGRYGINEVFCFNTAWRRTVEQLMYLSDAIVLDLRGLTAQREGTAYEIRRLAAVDLLPRVVAVGDEGTDWPHVEGLLRAEGQDPQRLVRLNLGTGPQLKSLFTRLLEVAAQQGAAADASRAGSPRSPA